MSKGGKLEKQLGNSQPTHPNDPGYCQSSSVWDLTGRLRKVSCLLIYPHLHFFQSAVIKTQFALWRVRLLIFSGRATTSICGASPRSDFPEASPFPVALFQVLLVTGSENS
uniref:Uncharacterized protein n=1 Tax=Anguilla anguilla TaxID=7936 RepID=A0A0E9X2U3_ANGAN